jgi:glutamate racemase
VLGCTHYAFLIPSINECLTQLTDKNSNVVNIIEPSYPVCLELKRQLEIRDLLSTNISGKTNAIHLEFYSSSLQINQSLTQLFSLLWQQPIKLKPIEL